MPYNTMDKTNHVSSNKQELLGTGSLGSSTSLSKKRSTTESVNDERPPCPGPKSDYRWDTKNRRWKKRSEKSKADQRDRYRRYTGNAYMQDYDLYLEIQLRSMMYRGYDLTFSDFEVRNENWYRWVEHHKAAEVAFAALLESARKPEYSRELVEETVAQNIISNVPGVSDADVVEIEIPKDTHPTESLKYTVEPVKVEGQMKVRRIVIYAEQRAKQTMTEHLKERRTNQMVQECTGMCYGADIFGVFRPLQQVARIRLPYRKHSRFCDVPSLVNDLIQERDPEYSRLLYTQALGMPCECLREFQPTPPKRIVCTLERYMKMQRFRVTRYSLFEKARRVLLRSYGVTRDPTFWMRTLMILRGLTNEGQCTRGVVVTMDSGGKRSAHKEGKG